MMQYRTIAIRIDSVYSKIMYVFMVVWLRLMSTAMEMFMTTTDDNKMNGRLK